jgi:hypothetical protein
MIHTVAILSHTGKILLARQFTHENRTQIEGHLGAFPKLVASASHAYIETETVRFVYQEISDIYIVLVVSKDSNIVGDLSTLTLLVDVTRGVAGDFLEDRILARGLDLIFAYDECVFDGLRQNFTASDIERFLKMDSPNENEFNRIRAEKEAKAAEERKRRAHELDEKKGRGDSLTSFIRGKIASIQGSPAVTGTSIPVTIERTTSIGPPKSHKQGVSGMSLSQGKKATRAQQMMAEEGLIVKAADGEMASHRSGLNIDIQERFSALLGRAGNVRELAVEGRLIASCGKPLSAHFSLTGDFTSAKYRFKLMQQPRGSLWQDERKLVFDNTGPKYGPNQEATLLCWRMTSSDSGDLPISINCWIPQATKQASTFSCEVELKRPEFVCETTILRIPLTSGKDIKVAQCDGTAEVFEREGYLQWTLDQLDADHNKCEIEFSVPVCDQDMFFPVSVTFEAPVTICNVDVSGVARIDDEGEEVPLLSVVKLCSTNKFEIE